MPVVVPLTNTETPAIGPSDSTDDLTVPVITLFCARIDETQTNINAKIRNTSFFIGERLY
jgi:hypothetical protein